ncbi:MAG: GNAT family N-acetyltransferase [Lacunisphaera sp.]
MKNDDEIVVRNNETDRRYEATVDGQLSVADYVVENGRVIFTHTFVPPELRGRNIAATLVRAALSDARARNLKVVPACSYVAKFIERHPEYRDLVAS